LKRTSTQAISESRDAFFSIATLFLSIAVAIIAALQWRVAHNKLRLDLFDRRYQVYDATRKFLATIVI
jgi:hypothetical protein